MENVLREQLKGAALARISRLQDVLTHQMLSCIPAAYSNSAVSQQALNQQHIAADIKDMQYCAAHDAHICHVGSGNQESWTNVKCFACRSC